MSEPSALIARPISPLQARRGFVFNAGELAALHLGDSIAPDAQSRPPLLSAPSVDAPVWRPTFTPADQSHASFGMTAVRPALHRGGTAETRGSSHGRSSAHSLQPPRISPWQGAATSPGLAVSPDAVDYFHQETRTRHSWRAVRNLGMVAGGRTLLTLGLAGALEGFVPGKLGANTTPMPPPAGTAPPPMHLFHPQVFALGVTAACIGLAIHTLGLASFYKDTACISLRRARFMLTLGTTGAVLVTAGGAYYLYGVLNKRSAATWEALPLRSLGNFCVYGAIPNSFSSSEMVHGDTPIRNRIFWRDFMFASGGMFLMTWAQISVPTPPAPLWARELAQSLGIICIAIGGALPRVDSMRSQANFRTDPNRRRNSTF